MYFIRGPVHPARLAAPCPKDKPCLGTEAEEGRLAASRSQAGRFTFTRAVPTAPDVGNDEWCAAKGCAAERNTAWNMAFPL